MTALSEYQRLEATGIWRPAAGEQRREVILSLGDATLQIFDANGTALTHWSLAAVVRLNPGEDPPRFGPEQESPEELEVEDPPMIEAIEKVRGAVSGKPARHGRLRRRVSLALVVCALLGLVFWVPGALVSYASGIVPPAARTAIGDAVMSEVERFAGRACSEPEGVRALDALVARLDLPADTRILVLRAGVSGSAHLPGGTILLNRAVVEDHDSSQVLAAYVLAEDERRKSRDPVYRLLSSGGVRAALGLLTTGEVPASVLASHAEHLLTVPPEPLAPSQLLERINGAGVSATPYAYALDISGETTLNLIEADQVPPAAAQLPLRDAEWVAVQTICGA
ncbi:MAG: hypothetical protein AAFR35_00395 [Pseudomonadota bacterium]